MIKCKCEYFELNVSIKLLLWFCKTSQRKKLWSFYC